MSPTGLGFSSLRGTGALNPINGLKTLLWRIGFAIRETGQALERTGSRLQGIHSYDEVVSRHMPVSPSKWSAPELAGDNFIAPSGLVLGSVSIGKSSSVWYNAIVRGDWMPVSIGANVSIQDSAYVGSSSEFSPAVEVGDNVVIRPGAVVKGATVHDNSIIGVKVVVSEGCEVGPNSIVQCGSYLEENTVVPEGELWAGSPAQKVRDLKPEELKYVGSVTKQNVELSGLHSEMLKFFKAKQNEFKG